LRIRQAPDGLAADLEWGSFSLEARAISTASVRSNEHTPRLASGVTYTPGNVVQQMTYPFYCTSEIRGYNILNQLT
jgi:hypothetical protein